MGAVLPPSLSLDVPSQPAILPTHTESPRGFYREATRDSRLDWHAGARMAAVVAVVAAAAAIPTELWSELERHWQTRRLQICQRRQRSTLGLFEWVA
jgi:hypothetical protein